ncbi:MAG: ABC transporter permease subunit [Thermoplasmatales archaeon]|nr:ABC transporter permease subunit [Thermoplasmatales archaeon]MCW6170323.1 ABC transporter permease subunit [Thermoplasmatales archaeon]
MKPSFMKVTNAFYLTFLRYYVRSWRFYGMLIVSALLSVMMATVYFSGAIKFPHLAASFISDVLGNVTLVIVVVAVFFGGDAFAQDFYSGTGLMILTQPISRISVYVGRLFGALTSGVLVIGVYYAVDAAASLYHYSSIPAGIVSSYGLAILFLLASLSFAFFFSTLFRSIPVSIISSFMLLFVGFLAIEQVVLQLGREPWYILTYGGDAIDAVPLPTYPPHISSYVINGVQVTSYFPTVAESVIIMLSYFAITTMISIIVYNARQLR